MTRAIAIRIVPARAALAAAAAAALALAGCTVSSSVSRDVGARCDSADECNDRCLAPGAAFPGGFCSLSCEASGDCPVAARCADAEGGVCLFSCDADPECEFLGDGWRCLEVSLREDAARKVKVCLGA